MKILHTSDWHLGRTLHGVDLLPDQERFHDWLVDLVASRGIDAVVVPGDVYDRAVPPAAAVDLLSRTLARLAEITTVILTPGNHDSAVRLGFASGILRDGVHILASTEGIEHPVSIEDEHGEVLFFGLPYLEPDIARIQLAADDAEPLARSHEAVTVAALDRVRTRLADHPDARSVVLAHTFVTGGAPSDSERDLRVGGVDSVPARVLSGIDYLALGHLHGCQDLSAQVGAPAWYSGSPLAFSFSEKDHRKAVLIIDLDADGVADVERVPTPVPRPLTELRGTLEQILESAPEHREDWTRAIVTDAVRPPHLQETLRSAFAHLLLTEYAPEGRAAAGITPPVRQGADPVQVMDEFLAFVTGGAPDPAEHAVLEDAYGAVRAARHDAAPSAGSRAADRRAS